MTTYFSRSPDSPENQRRVPLEYGGRTYSWHSSTGVFHQKGLDVGTDLLLALTHDLPGERILDLGCGHGPLGLFALLDRPEARAWLVDVNPRACAAAARNRKALKSRAFVVEGDGATGFRPESFDLVLTNPPIRTGLPTLRRLFQEAEQAMVSGGLLAFVCRPKQGGRRLAEIAGEILRSAPEKLGRNKGFEVFCLKKDAGPAGPGIGSTER